jgi:hypothetical protein
MKTLLIASVTALAVAATPCFASADTLAPVALTTVAQTAAATPAQALVLGAPCEATAPAPTFIVEQVPAPAPTVVIVRARPSVGAVVVGAVTRAVVWTALEMTFHHHGHVR